MNAKLPANAYPEERRLVTVMFADVQGFTTLAEHLDFETVSDLLKEIWLKLDQVIEENGGYIDKHMGDGVLAIWGAPSAGENDADSAVSAALDLLQAMDEYTSNSKEKLVKELKMRVGIHSGPVFAGYIGLKNEYTILGDTVNVASRLEQYAEAGTIIISESTHQLIRGNYSTTNPEPVLLRGKQDPVMTYLIDGSQVSTGRGNYRGSESMETHMVGREQELAHLAHLFTQSRKSEIPTVVIISGDTGMGKSRLMMEFSKQLRENDPSLWVLSARALVQASNMPFYLWKMLWYNRFGLRDNEESKVNNDKFLWEIQKLWGKGLSTTSVIETAHIIGHVIGLDWPDSPYLAALTTPVARVERAAALTRALLSRICAAHTTVLMIDDLHSVDKSSMELLSYLLGPDNKPVLPLFILAGSRPEFLQQQPEWADVAHVINLHALPASADLVLKAYPDLKGYPASILEALARRAEGNPYFLEEMVKFLVKASSEVTTPVGDATETAIKRLKSKPPESLQAALQARLDTLPRSTRFVALLAALVGRVFWVGAVITAMRQAGKLGTGSQANIEYAEAEHMVHQALRQLEQAELVFPKAGNDFSNEQEYIFKSSLLRDVAYNLILLRYRPFYHKAVADWLANHTDVDFKFMAAEHYEWAGWPANAARQYAMVAYHYQQRGATEEAKKMMVRAERLREQAQAQKAAQIRN